MSDFIVSFLEYTIYAIVTVMTGYLFCLSCYMLFLGLFGYTKNKKDYPDCPPEARFLILVAAHNEEAVIGATLNNLTNIKYDNNLFDIVVVNDNSTDNTGAICDEHGVKHVDTIEGEFVREGVGKPAGIQYALRKLGFDTVKANYDLIMILDADNFVDDNILSELNSQWLSKGKPEAIQTYLDCKNSSSLLSFGYCTSYWMMNRFFQLSKYRLGLPNAIGGTGFVVSSEYLINGGGFCFKSLTEDLELEIDIVRNGGRILWNHNTRVYDEKPDNFRVSLKQRYRWSKGHWYVAFSNVTSLVKLAITERKWKYVDQIFYLFSMGRALQVCVIGANILFLTLVKNNLHYTVDATAIAVDGVAKADATFLDYIAVLFNAVGGISLIVQLNFFTLLSIAYGMLFLPIFATKMDKGIFLNPFKVFLSGLYFGLSFGMVQVLALFRWKKQNTWVATPHNKTKEEHK